MSGTGTSDRLVSALVEAGLLDPRRAEEARSVVGRELAPAPTPVPAPAPDRGARPQLAEVAAYAGAALVAAAIFLLGMQYWADLTRLQRSLLLVGVAAVLVVAAVVVLRLAGRGVPAGRQGPGLRARYLAGTLLTGAAVAGFAVGSWVLPMVTDSLLLLLGAQLLLELRDAGWAHAATAVVALVLFALYTPSDTPSDTGSGTPSGPGSGTATATGWGAA